MNSVTSRTSSVKKWEKKINKQRKWWQSDGEVMCFLNSLLCNGYGVMDPCSRTVSRFWLAKSWSWLSAIWTSFAPLLWKIGWAWTSGVVRLSLRLGEMRSKDFMVWREWLALLWCDRRDWNFYGVGWLTLLWCCVAGVGLWNWVSWLWIYILGIASRNIIRSASRLIDSLV